MVSMTTETLRVRLMTTTLWANLESSYITWVMYILCVAAGDFSVVEQSCLWSHVKQFYSAYKCDFQSVTRLWFQPHQHQPMFRLAVPLNCGKGNSWCLSEHWFCNLLFLSFSLPRAFTQFTGIFSSPLLRRRWSTAGWTTRKRKRSFLPLETRRVIMIR